MKIALACEGNNITEHFGYCKNFNVFEVEDGKVVKKESYDNPGHKPGFLPEFLNKLGVNVVVSGGMGNGAVTIFNEHNIEVILGISGSDTDAVNKYIKGELKSTGSVCHEHMHKDECGE